jgi:hypothetical protein
MKNPPYIFPLAKRTLRNYPYIFPLIKRKLNGVLFERGIFLIGPITPPSLPLRRGGIKQWLDTGERRSDAVESVVCTQIDVSADDSCILVRGQNRRELISLNLRVGAVCQATGTAPHTGGRVRGGGNENTPLITICPSWSMVVVAPLVTGSRPRAYV